MKKMTLPVAVAVAIIGCVLAVSANVTASKAQQSLNQERFRRMSIEEQLQTALSKVKGLQAQLAETQKKIGSIQGILDEGNSARADLEKQLKEMAEQKAALQQQLTTGQGAEENMP